MKGYEEIKGPLNANIYLKILLKRLNDIHLFYNDNLIRKLIQDNLSNP